MGQVGQPTRIKRLFLMEGDIFSGKGGRALLYSETRSSCKCGLKWGVGVFRKGGLLSLR